MFKSLQGYFSTLRPIPVSIATSGLALWLLIFYNRRFWSETWLALPTHEPKDIAFLVGLFLALWLLLTAILNLFAWRGLFPWLMVFVLMVSASAAHFMDSYGIFINRDLIHSIRETDSREALDLVSLTLLANLLFWGLIPAWLVRRLPIAFAGLSPVRIGKQILFSLACALVAGVLVYGNFSYYAAFFRNHGQVRYYINPSNYFYAVFSFVRRTLREAPVPLAPVAADVRMNPGFAPKKSVLWVMVVGETARAANFQLGGYPRETNPQLSAIPGLIYYSDVHSCGTDTNESLPCMFSNLSRKDYSTTAAARRENILDVMKRAGVRAVWLDNNTGCKNICKRVETVELRDAKVPGICDHGECYDSVLQYEMERQLDPARPFTLMVMHQNGSHGPAYYKRYPDAFKRFVPACESGELYDCKQEQIVAAYDNTILYTDHNLAEVVRFFEKNSDRYTGGLFYISDHGESLGENNLYLHGVPYTFAPEAQKHVPMMLWFTPDYPAESGIDTACLTARRGEAYTHQNLFHTLMGLMALESADYRAELDLTAACRAKGKGE
ncbi:MAG: phosphoethanolamine--lipid A transferase [Magnetococcales bacterium]|nr:phosphoethanolamine--lipid A transferase [Magnetococcales bacterium]